MQDDAGASALARTNSYMNSFLNEYLYRDLVPFDPGYPHYKNLQIVSALASNAAPEDEIVYPSFCRPLVIAEPKFRIDFIGVHAQWVDETYLHCAEHADRAHRV